MKEGYKKTELGWIPQEWEVSSLSDIAEINPKKEVLDNEKKVSFIAMEHISNAGRVINKDIRNYGEVAKGYTAFKDEDVLLAKITPCFENGKKAVVRNLKNGYGFGSTEFHVLRSRDERSIPEFLYYYVSANKFRQQAALNMTGSAGQKRVPTTFLNDNRLAVPPLKEQQKIAEILSSVDSQIDDTDKLIKKTKKLKKGLMQRLLTKGIGHTEFKITEIGKIPVQWKVKKLGEIGEVVMGQSPVGDSYNDKEIGTPLLNGPTEFTERYPIPKQWTTKPTKICNENDVLFCVRGSSVGRMNISDNKYCIGRGLAAIREKDGQTYTTYLYYILQKFINDILSLSAGSTFPNVGKDDLNSLLCTVPPIDEQAQIGDVLLTVDNEIEEYQNKKNKLEELKKGLMQQLLSGKIRVK